MQIVMCYKCPISCIYTYIFIYKRMYIYIYLCINMNCYVYIHMCYKYSMYSMWIHTSGFVTHP